MAETEPDDTARWQVGWRLPAALEPVFRRAVALENARRLSEGLGELSQQDAAAAWLFEASERVERSAPGGRRHKGAA